MSATRAAAVLRIARVAAELSTINDRLVFIGGNVLPLLVDVDRCFDAPRPTKDVDAVTATATYAAKHRIEEALRQAGYRDAMEKHTGRFNSPSGEVFDISFAGEHAGATGAVIDTVAIETAVLHEGPPPFRHVSAIGFFLMKCAAFHDRGAKAPENSRDLADLAVLLAAGEQVREATARSEERIRKHVRDAATGLLGARDLRSGMTGHLRDRRPILPDTPESLATSALERLAALAELAKPDAT